MKYTIKSPVKKFTGKVASVSFLNGIGETESDHLASWFKDHKYEVITNVSLDEETIKDVDGNAETSEEKAADRVDKDQEGNEPETDELKLMTVEELRAYADENNIDLGRATTQEGILEKIKAAQKE